jgi:RNA polymerase sigma factor (sigma-70 family)
VLRDGHAAEDAFQVTFLVLARRAGSIRNPETLGPWLYGVATRTARKARTKEARRCHRERRASIPRVIATNSLDWEDLRLVLDEAVARLPEKYRVAFVLHHLQGLTVAEVARRLACPQGTVAARLARAKERLRGGLARRGLALTAAGLSTALAQGVATASVPAPLIAGTVEVALRVAAAKTAGSLFAAAATFMRGGLQAMSSSKLSAALAGLAVSAVVGVGVWQFEWSGAGKPGAGNNGGRRAFRGAPVNERFYAGGFQSLRGWAFRGVGPEVDGFKVGGDFMWLNSVEYQIPVRANNQLYFVTFLDSGTVESNVSIHNYRVAAGVGARIIVPALGPVPVALDFGFPVVQESQNFSFWLGFTS